MSVFDRLLQQEANELCQTGAGTPGKLIALTHAGFRAWANLTFPPEKRFALLQEILRYCASQCLLACCFTQEYRLQEIAPRHDHAAASQDAGHHPPCARASDRGLAAGD
ncbi:hypothetical protein E6A55_33195 (plasmid) [Cupriavidus necator H16]|uniref:Uncharacterized protein n=1 Tax=Cupriavidus necator (strain ATCC 17699 / DSM 428 / KCTC 22496 / NCIMB 10442 / H16 / Stanier 337) TaxID=381666 RepID=A0AAF1D5F5_CUPNH|nr:hypothetical protein E6A55_33195 [Cupriavidus necator H16]